MSNSDSLNNLGFEFTAMACPCEIRIAGLDEQLSGAAAQAAIAEVRRIEQKYSRYRDDSIISQINAAAGTGRAIVVDEETMQLFKFAQSLYAQSGGLFDITSGVLRRAWDFKAKRIPSAADIASLLPLVSMGLVTLGHNSLSLTKAEMQLDFGGFGKEYAADRAAMVLQQHGVRHGFVNLGGDIHVLGSMPDGAAWTIGIAHPRLSDKLLASIQIHQGAAATSGDSERYFEIADKRYCHVLSPKTGWPVSTWQSVSVIASNAVMAGALTTIALLKEERAIEFLGTYELPYLAINQKGALFKSEASKLIANQAHRGVFQT